MSGLRIVLRGLHDTFENLAYFALISLFWWACQFSVVFGPAATLALFIHADPRHGTVTDRPSIQETLQLLYRNLWAAWRLVLIALPFVALLVYNAGYYGESTGVLGAVTPLWIALLVLCPAVIWSAFALSALEPRGAVAAYKTALLLVAARMPAVLLITLLLAIILPIGAVLVVPAAVFLPATVAAIFNRFVLTSLRVAIPDPLAPTAEREREGPEPRRRLFRR